MKFPWFSWFRRKKKQPVKVRGHVRPLSPDVDHTIDRHIYFRPIQPGAACPHCRKTLIQEVASYIVITFDDNGQETDRFMIGGDFGHYCPNCPTIVVNPADVKPYLDIARAQFEAGQSFIILGRVALESFTEEEKNTPVGELESIPLVPFHTNSSPGKQKKKRHKKSRGK